MSFIIPFRTFINQTAFIMDDQNIHRLISLKRYECPPPNAVEDFIVEFHRRQRVELLSPSFWKMFKERVALLLADFKVPKMAYVTTTALALLVAFFILRSENFDFSKTSEPNNPSSYRTSTGLDQAPSPVIIERALPLSLDINSEDRNDDSVVSPLSFILEKKQLQKGSPLIF